MNGNDIAKLLRVDSWYQLITREEIAYVLEKQQAEIESLKANTLTDAIKLLEKYANKLEDERPNKGLSDVVLDCVEILRKAQEK